MQKYTSKNTSINSSKLPAVYNNRKVLSLIKGKAVLDIGGGKYDNVAKALAGHSSVSVFDPYNRSKEHNRVVLKGHYDVSIVSNVLNVIKEQEERQKTIRLAAEKSDVIIIKIYEGNKSGIGRVTKKDCWQNNMKTQDYLPEIRAFLKTHNITRHGQIIICRKDVYKDAFCNVDS